MKYYIRAEIEGEFVVRYEFENEKEATKTYNELHDQFIYDDLEMWQA